DGRLGWEAAHIEVARELPWRFLAVLHVDWPDAANGAVASWMRCRIRHSLLALTHEFRTGSAKSYCPLGRASERCRTIVPCPASSRISRSYDDDPLCCRLGRGHHPSSEAPNQGLDQSWTERSLQGGAGKARRQEGGPMDRKQRTPARLGLAAAVAV